jgi:hypothetical protein
MTTKIDTDTMMKDAKGRLVPMENIREIDRLRDDLVRRLTARYDALRAQCIEFRAWADSEINAFLELSNERYGLKLGGQAGNLTLASYDGSLRILRAVQKNIAFTEEIHAAKQLIDQCLVEWCQGARPELKVVVDDAFKVDSKGDLAAERVLGLRRLKIDDPRWISAMEAIADACWVDSTKQYLRFYDRSSDGTYTLKASGV